jgi:hypothetical protein
VVVPSLAHKRGTRAQINAAAAASQLRAGEVYLITDEARLTVGTAANAHQAAAKQGEGSSDPWTWLKLSADVANSTITLASVTGLSFTAAANTTYIVELVGAFQSAATTTGIALALALPAGAGVAGLAQHAISLTALGPVEQIAAGASVGVTSGVRAAATNIPISGRWIVQAGATGGTVQLQFRSEIAASAVTMRAGLTALGFRVI